MDVAHAPCLQLAHGPFAGRAELRGICQAGAVLVSQIPHGVHDLGTTAGASPTATELRGLDTMDNVQIHMLQLLLRYCERRHNQSQRKKAVADLTGHNFSDCC